MNPTASPQNQSLDSSMEDYVPPKNWEEITSDEKIERMREVIKHLSTQVANAQTSIHYLRLKLRTHEHIDGKVYEVKEIKDYDDSIGGELVGTATLSNENYF